MSYGGIMSKAVESATWQDYRASETSMVVYYPSDPVSEMPIREIPEEYPSTLVPEPNYESATYGFYGCERNKIRAVFVKSKLHYLFFITKYAGTREEFKNKVFLTGYYRIHQVADVKKTHIRYCADFSCIDEDACYALRADEVRFVDIDDAYEVNSALLKSWGYKARVTRQTRIVLDEEKTATILEYLRSKEDKTEEYIAETKRLQPHDDEEEEE